VLASAANIQSEDGQGGNGTTKRAELPVEVLSGVTMISAGSRHSIVH
jgi:hypothetical protein